MNFYIPRPKVQAALSPVFGRFWWVLSLLLGLQLGQMQLFQTWTSSCHGKGLTGGTWRRLLWRSVTNANGKAMKTRWFYRSRQHTSDWLLISHVDGKVSYRKPMETMKFSCFALFCPEFGFLFRPIPRSRSGWNGSVATRACAGWYSTATRRPWPVVHHVFCSLKFISDLKLDGKYTSNHQENRHNRILYNKVSHLRYGNNEVNRGKSLEVFGVFCEAWGRAARHQIPKSFKFECSVICLNMLGPIRFAILTRFQGKTTYTTFVVHSLVGFPCQFRTKKRENDTVSGLGVAVSKIVTGKGDL